MQYIKDNIVRNGNRIVIKTETDNGTSIIINPTHEMILADGWEEYTPPVPDEEVTEASKEVALIQMLLEQYNNRTDITDEEALARPILINDWSTYVGKSLTTGQIVSYEDNLWRVRQDITTVVDTQAPGTATAALYEVINIENSGTLSNPISYTPPMEIYNGKYYIQNGVTYLCTRDSGTALSHDLSALVGLYVSKVEN